MDISAYSAVRKSSSLRVEQPADLQLVWELSDSAVCFAEVASLKHGSNSF